MSRESSPSVPNGGLSLQGIQEGSREAMDVVYAPDVAVCAVLPHEVTVGLCNPVPQQAEDEPATRKGSHKQEEDKAPADLHKGGPEVQQVCKMVAVLDVAKLNIAVAVLAHQASFALSSWLDVTLEQLEHPGAGGGGSRITLCLISFTVFMTFYQITTEKG